MILILFLIPTFVSSCELFLHPNNVGNVTRVFMNYIGRDDIRIVFMNIYMERATQMNTFDLYQVPGANDTFLSWRWVWASSEGAFILRLPLDYPMMSLGVLAATAEEMDVLLYSDPPGCEIDTQDLNQQIAQILIENVTHSVGYDANGFVEQGEECAEVRIQIVT